MFSVQRGDEIRIPEDITTLPDNWDFCLGKTYTVEDTNEEEITVWDTEKDTELTFYEGEFEFVNSYKTQKQKLNI